jgi:hypothetical protein
MANISGLGLATKGYTSPQGGGGVATITVAGITPAATYLDVQFSDPVVLATLGQDPANWVIAPAFGVFPATVLAVAEQTADTIRLTISEMTNGASYSLETLVGLVETPAHDASNKQETTPFVAVGVAATITAQVAQTSRSVLLTFSKPMYLPDLADITKFSIIGPAPAVTPLNVVAAASQSPTSALLTTDVMRPDTGADFYTASSTARSAAGN